ncbi:GrpB family protein [Leucothrix arctica]|uniref:GrpB family protein n=1 Tax=Leucothrix arctica TaxID=1481894 RepID=A0A317CLT9_9GAMM|nr:GrpB family protein [Leucothrix arctica]PWQ99555.1 GrpB family protein [Leucothrix arctica]
MYIYPHKAEWFDEYQYEAELIQAAYNGSITLKHIGSTAVEGLYAKDCIDILGIVSDLSVVQKSVAALKELGYKHKGSYGIEGREYFSKPHRQVHLHIFQEGSAEIDKHFGFVQLLQTTPELLLELNTLKQALHTKHPTDKNKYQLEKSSFYYKINKILSK